MLSDLVNAFSFLTVLPTGWLKPDIDRAPGRAFSYFPLVGLVIGLLASAVASIRFLPADVTAFLALVDSWQQPTVQRAPLLDFHAPACWANFRCRPRMFEILHGVEESAQCTYPLTLRLVNFD